MIPFGPYLLQRRIAVGGMAEVFLATHRDRRGEPLVVKRILPHLERKPDFVHMFEDEARVSSRLFHPNLVRIHDCGIEKAVHFIAMEYVDGLSLSNVLKGLPSCRMSPELGCWIAAEACAGLSYAHTLTDLDGRPLGIVHRDISPDNILLSRAGEVKLADFGIAKASTRLTQTRPGQRKGKLTYMSPEQATGQPVDARSDIFSLGTVLYEMTTGARVFAGNNEAEVLKAVVADDFDAPGQRVAGYPPALTAIVERSLAKSPEQRFDNAAALREALKVLIPANFDAIEQLSALVRRLSGNSPPMVENSGPRTMQAMNETRPEKLGVAETGVEQPRTARGILSDTAPLVALRGAHESAVETTGTATDNKNTPRPSGPAVVVGKPDVSIPAPPSTRTVDQLVGPAPPHDDTAPTEAADNNLTARWIHPDPAEWVDPAESTVDIGWDPGDLKKLEGTPWGWVVLISIAAILAAVTLLLYYQD